MPGPRGSRARSSTSGATVTPSRCGPATGAASTISPRPTAAPSWSAPSSTPSDRPGAGATTSCSPIPPIPSVSTSGRSCPSSPAPRRRRPWHRGPRRASPCATRWDWPIRSATPTCPPERSLDDGLPQSLEAYVAVQGLRWLKVKVGGDHEADLDRLASIARLLDKRPGAGRFAVSLDGNEQYAELDGFAALLARIERDLPAFHDAIAYVEQPLERSVALDEEQAAGIAAVSARKPMIIDESDGDLDSFERAVELGYRGVSTKNCKGLFKALANAALARRLSGERGVPFLITAEDLMNLPVVPLHQDLAHVAALGLDHAERNGHHYVRGLDHLSLPEQERVLGEHEGLYRRTEESGFLHVAEGAIDVRSLQRCPGLGAGSAFDPGAMVPLEDWRFESLR